MPSLDLDVDPGKHIGVLGITGTGKTELEKKLITLWMSQHRRVLALDPKDELSIRGRPRPKTQVGPLPFRWEANQVAQAPSVLLNPNLAMAVVPDQVGSGRSAARAFKLLATLLKAYWEDGHDFQTILLLPETQLWADYERRLLEDVANTYRDLAGVTLVVDSQRAAGVPIDARASLQQIISFAQSEPADIDALKDRCSLTDPTFHERVSRLTPESHSYEFWRVGQQFKGAAHVDGDGQREGSNRESSHDERAGEAGGGSGGDHLPLRDDGAGNGHDQLDVQGGPVPQGEAEVTVTADAPSDGAGEAAPPSKPKPNNKSRRRRRRAA